jgi:hypothetical protein
MQIPRFARDDNSKLGMTILKLEMTILKARDDNSEKGYYIPQPSIGEFQIANSKLPIPN